MFYLLGQFVKKMRNTLKVFKCDAGEGSAGLVIEKWRSIIEGQEKLPTYNNTKEG